MIGKIEKVSIDKFNDSKITYGITITFSDGRCLFIPEPTITNLRTVAEREKKYIGERS